MSWSRSSSELGRGAGRARRRLSWVAELDGLAVELEHPMVICEELVSLLAVAVDARGRHLHLQLQEPAAHRGREHTRLGY